VKRAVRPRLAGDDQPAGHGGHCRVDRRSIGPEDRRTSRRD
jgi:hypothetical protein